MPCNELTKIITYCTQTSHPEKVYIGKIFKFLPHKVENEKFHIQLRNVHIHVHILKLIFTSLCTLQIKDVTDILNAEIPNFKAVATVVALANRAAKGPTTTAPSATANGERENPSSQACSVM